MQRTKLTQYVGGNPTIVQIELIERCAWLALHLHKIDARTVVQGSMSEGARREYLGWANAYSRILSRLGGEQELTPHYGLTLEDVIAEGRSDG